MANFISLAAEQFFAHHTSMKWISSVTVDLMLAVGIAVPMLTFTATILSRARFGRGSKSQTKSSELPPISILKPLKGLDEGIKRNLESFFRLEYPKFELLFSVSEESDPVVPLVRELFLKYPNVKASLIVGAVNIGLNPKVNNLVRSYEASSYEAVLISDSNTRVDKDFLRRMGNSFKPDVALLFSVVAGTGARGLGAQMDALALNTVYARGLILASAAGHSCVMGKAMILRKSVLNSFGGIRALGGTIAEDYLTGQLFHRAGHKVILHNDPIRQHMGWQSFGAYWQRTLRWGRIRKGHAPFVFFFLEPLLTSVGSGLIGAAAFYIRLGVSPFIYFTVHMLAWAISDSLLIRSLGAVCSRRIWGAWLLRECVQLPLWLHTSLGSTVLWRGQRLGLREACKIECLPFAQREIFE
jgi:ceramide glucosyltransferase